MGKSKLSGQFGTVGPTVVKNRPTFIKVTEGLQNIQSNSRKLRSQ
jgi:hypothetical protein